MTKPPEKWIDKLIAELKKPYHNNFDEEFEDFYWERGIYKNRKPGIEEYKFFFRSQIKKLLEEVKNCVPEEKEVKLEKPRLFQVNPERNEMGGYSSMPFYCSLCGMSEIDIQDNKLEDGNYVCNCSVWDNPMGGEWVKWSDEKKALQILKEMPSEDNSFNSCREQTLKAIELLLK